MRLTPLQLAKAKLVYKALQRYIKHSNFTRTQVTQVRENLILFIIEETNEALARRITAIKP